jgi:ribulose-bisphosphate carboxylase large chain
VQLDDVPSIVSWADRPPNDRYIKARYRFASVLPVEEAAASMALERSICRLDYAGHDLSGWAGRVVEVHDLGPTRAEDFAPYALQYGHVKDVRLSAARIGVATLAFPLRLCGSDLLRMMSVLVGEIPRLGYLCAARLIDIELPDGAIAPDWGPRWGLARIRAELRSRARPILIRSARPAVGIPTEEMENVGRAVLRGGFDMLKDDELTFDSDLSPAVDRYARMARVARAAEQETGERKFYMANVIAARPHSLELADAAAEAGADALLVAPMYQGLDFPRLASERTGLLVLAHNCGDDFVHRHPRIGISPAAWIKILRLAGADMVFLPGSACAPGDDADLTRACCAAAFWSGVVPSLPLIAGGKRWERLADYARALGTVDFGIVAATALDEHAEGVEGGARAFREAADSLASL